MAERQQLPSARNSPRCLKCRTPMQWKGSRRSFTARGVGTLDTYACESCGEIIQRDA